MKDPKIKDIICQLKAHKISPFEVPEEYENNNQILDFERKRGLRVTGRRGFDVISNSYFVEEELFRSIDYPYKRNIVQRFDSFDAYFDYLNGDIYQKACYTFCNVSDITTSKQKINTNRLMEPKSFVEHNIDTYSLPLSSEELDQYENGKDTHVQCKQWVARFNTCASLIDFKEIASKYMRTASITSTVGISFFLFNYIFHFSEDIQRLSAIADYIFSTPRLTGEYDLICALCTVYKTDEILQYVKCSKDKNPSLYDLRNDIRTYIRALKSDQLRFIKEAYFDKKTHYFVERTQIRLKSGYGRILSTLYRYFESFDSFAAYRNRDLTLCDLSSFYKSNIDFTSYIVDETTRFPVQTNIPLNYFTDKFYRNGYFFVIQTWSNPLGYTIKTYKHKFQYFFDFVAFLKGDLSNADLILCDGLEHLSEWECINFSNAKLKSSLMEKFGLKYVPYKINAETILTFNQSERNERHPPLVSRFDEESISTSPRSNSDSLIPNPNFSHKSQRIHYISDIHLMHRINNAACKSLEDILYVIRKIVDQISSEYANILLIDGDIASSFSVFRLFVSSLAKSISHKTIVVFTLGNHELWDFPSESLDNIAAKYRTLLNSYGMYFLHNDLLYKVDCDPSVPKDNGVRVLHYQTLCGMSREQISKNLKNARFVILGGLGLSGYNSKFNADNGIYRGTLNRDEEIKETKKFEALYNALLPILSRKNTIILTHTPKSDWCQNSRPDKNFVYISGHTHKNFFHDDGEHRVYSDNQIGYHNESVHLKSFLIDNDYDLFEDYKDGIYKITNVQYNDFYRGKRLQMTFTRSTHHLYMLKRSGYYCFIAEFQNGNLSILNGGALKSLSIPDITYYYDNMESMIRKINEPLSKFTAFQDNIASFIKKIGGSGEIHGCIIDINFYNHIYVNPSDLTITAYYATDIIYKVVYPSVPALLEANCPSMFEQYTKLIGTNPSNPIAPKHDTHLSIPIQEYLETDIYKASREIKKMQKLHSNILTSWYENISTSAYPLYLP